MELKITSLHQEQYERDGYAIVRSGFSATTSAIALSPT